MSRSKLTRAQLLAYALPNLGVAILFTPATAFLPNVYAKNTAVTLGAIGTVLIVLRIFDAILDQVVGFASDRTRTRLGSRLPWMLVGTPLFMVSAYFLYSPAPTADLWYFAGWSLVFYVAYTMLNIPYLAWGAEIAADYQERSTVFAWYALTSQLGGFIFFGAPLVLAATGVTATSEFGQDALFWVMCIGVVVLPLVMVFATIRVPRAVLTSEERPTLSGVWDALLHNKPLRLYIIAFSCSITGTGAFAAAIVIFFDSRLGMGAQMPYLFLGMTILGIVMIYPWTRVVQRFGKHRSWAVTWGACAFILPTLALVDPASPNALAFTFAIMFTWAIVDAVSNMVPFAVLADIVEFERLRSGQDRAGNFYAFANLVVKGAAAIGGGLGYLLLEWSGYDVKNAAANGAGATAGLIVAALILPSALKLIGAALVWHFPIDVRRAAVIRKRLEQLDARAAARDANIAAPAADAAPATA